MLSIIIPTYNEKENILQVVERIFKVLTDNNIEGEVVVVDDDSPDGTANVAEGLKNRFNVNVIVRKDERGLSSAAIKGMESARGDILCVMDADLSHPPEALPKMLKYIENGEAELVVGSRHITGGGIENWTLKRKMVSKCASILARPVTKVKDPMSGFFMLKREVIEGVELKPKGYKIGLEIMVKGNYKNLVEVPYIFKDRAHGESKLGGKVIKNYLSHVISLYFYKDSPFYQFLKFCVVGAIGTVINLAVLYSLVEWFKIWYIIGATIAFGVAVTSNYILNKIWTFRDKTTKPSVVFGSYIKFIIVSIIGLVINLTILYLLVEYVHIWYIFSQIIAIIGATVWNYIGSKTWAFRK